MSEQLLYAIFGRPDWSPEIERLAHALAEATPDSGDDCFDATCHDLDDYEDAGEDRDYYRKYAHRLLSTLTAPAPPSPEGDDSAGGL